MVPETILPERLKTIRKARKIGRTKLAKLSGLTERQLTKLETAKGVDLPATSLMQLAHVLQVTPYVLTGEFALDESDLQPASTSSCTSGCCG